MKPRRFCLSGAQRRAQETRGWLVDVRWDKTTVKSTARDEKFSPCPCFLLEMTQCSGGGPGDQRIEAPAIDWATGLEWFLCQGPE